MTSILEEGNILDSRNLTNNKLLKIMSAFFLLLIIIAKFYSTVYYNRVYYCTIGCFMLSCRFSGEDTVSRGKTCMQQSLQCICLGVRTGRQGFHKAQWQHWWLQCRGQTSEWLNSRGFSPAETEYKGLRAFPSLLSSVKSAFNLRTCCSILYSLTHSYF